MELLFYFYRRFVAPATEIVNLDFEWWYIYMVIAQSNQVPTLVCVVGIS